MATLQYRSLDPSKKGIRLLALLNGEWDDRIRCELYTVSLQDQPKYEALSYVWGSSTDLIDIDVNDVAFPATLNLHAALRRLREQIRSTERNEGRRTLWVDAVCINQRDNAEKTYQVQLMGDIYSQTTNGLLWLGEQPDEPPPVVAKEGEDEVARVLKATDDLLQQISAPLPQLNIAEELLKMPEVKFRPGVHDFKIPRTRPEHWDPKFRADKLALEADSLYQVDCLLTLLGLGSHLKWIAHLQYEPDDMPATFRTNTRQALHWLGTRPWWTRIWTMQECILPRESELLYGPVRIPWRRFLTGISNFQKHRTSCCADVPGINDMLNDLVDTVLPCLILHRYCHSEDFNLSEFADDLEDPSHVSSLFRPESLLWTFRHRQATDPRDKIYGILSLLKGHSAKTGNPAKELIIPDYSPEMNVERVFTKAVFSIMQFSASLDIICQPGYVSHDFHSGLPSWVPNFSESIVFAGSLDRYLKQLPCYSACAGQGVSPSVIEENILVLEGFLVDAVSSTSVSMAYQVEKEQQSIMRQWYTFVEEFYNTGASKNPTSAGIDWKDRFWRTLCGDTIMTQQRVLVQQDFKAPLRRIPAASISASPANEEIAWNLWCQVQGLDELRIGQVLPTTASDLGDPAVGNIGYAIKTSTAGRRMFASTNGHLGLGPPISGLTSPHNKDRIFIFPGGKTPFILRYVGMRHVPGLGMQPSHEMIGDCYLDGFMDGEGMKNFNDEKQTVYIV
ncbi:heterokaryon incompatibility protein-domain-containing protein [Nemania sp. FL0031]|nr:heterokaryon incompatibility protein-domain-containing protein [Nemania sp. FL0031]